MNADSGDLCEGVETRVFPFPQADFVVSGLVENRLVENAIRFGLGCCLMSVADYCKDGHSVGSLPTQHGRSLQVYLARHSPQVVAESVRGVDVAAAVAQVEADVMFSCLLFFLGTLFSFCNI